MTMKSLSKIATKHIFGLFITLLLALVFFIYSDYLLLKKLFLFKDIGSDTLNAFFPLFVHVADYLRNDGIPLWSFNRGMGQSILPVSLGAPFEWPLYAMGSDRLAYGIAYMEAIKVVLGGTIFYLYLRQLSLSAYVCMIGGLLYAFSGFMIVGGSWYVFSTMAVYLALLLYAFERYLQHGVWWPFPLAISLIAADYIFNLYTHAVFLAFYGLFRYYDHFGWNPKSMAIFFLKVAGLGILGAGIASVFLFANVQEILQSHRVGGEAGSLADYLRNKPVLAFANTGEYVVSLLRAFSSNMTGVASGYHGDFNYLEDPLFYCGLVSLLLAPQVFVSLERRQRIIYSVLALIFILPVILPYFRYAFWLFSGGYYRVLSLFIILPALLFAAKALENIMASGKLNLGLLVITLLVLLSCLLYPYEWSGKYAKVLIDPSLKWITAAFLCLYALLITGLSRKKFRTPAASLLLMAVCVELGMSASMSVNGRPVVTATELHERVGYNDYSVDMIEHLKKNDPEFYRIEKAYTSGPTMHMSLNDGMVQGYRGTSSYQSLNKDGYLDFMDAMGLMSESANRDGQRWITGLGSRPVLMLFASVKYLLIKDQKVLPAYTEPWFRTIGQIGDVVAVQNLFALPFGFTYDTYMPRDEFMRLQERQKDSALIKSVVLDAPLEATINGRYKRLSAESIGEIFNRQQFEFDLRERQSQALHIESFSQNKIMGRITLNQDRLLFFTIPYDDGWQAHIDGVPAKLLRVNIGFTGLMVGPGVHTIELTYRPPYWVTSWILTLISLLVYLFYLMRTKTSARPNSAQPLTTS